MISEIFIVIISFSGTLIGTFAGIITSTKLTNFRLKQLENKVDKHNQIIERTYKLEEKVKNNKDRIQEICKEMNR